jgi:anaerobic selenocysteine-containing dehydrogenase
VLGEGIAMQVKGCCPLDCQDSCSWVAHVADDRVVRVEGARDHPVTRGVLCAKVRDYEARVTEPERLLQPLRRTGAKGSGAFEPISWNDALDAIAARFKAIVAQHGAEALLPFQYLGSMGVVQRFALLRIFHALGASLQGGAVCGASASALLAEQHPMNVDPEETPQARLILLWGQNVLTTCHHQWHFIEQARANGARVIAIDPRQTRTSKMCDAHLAPVPGSDAILAAAIGRHLLETGRADLDLAALWVDDLDAYRKMVAPWTFAAAAAATGLAVAEIAQLAEDFATARPALIRAGIAPQQARNGEAFVRGLSAIAILGGHWRHPGGGLSILSFPPLDEAAAGRPDLLKGSPRTLDMAKLAETLDPDVTVPPVKGLMVWSANPAVTQIDWPRLRRGLAREDLFTVVCDHFLTDTARFADIVLPATTQFEHFDIQGAWGHHYVTVNRPALAPRGEARSSGAIMRGLAPRLGLDHPAFRESDEEIAAAVLPAGWSLRDMTEPNWRKLPMPRPAIAPLASRLRIADGPLAVPASPAGKLQVLNPRSHYFLNSTFANMARQQKSQGQATVVMSAADAAARSLADGATVVLRGGAARIEAVLKVSDGLRAGILSLEGKWWDRDDPSAAAMNRLTPSAWSPAGQPAYNETYVTVEPA